MKEILGYNLKQFFDNIDKDCKNADITYAGDRYEVWKVSDDLFTKMCEMSEEEFVELAGDDAWWRQNDGSVLGEPDTTFYIRDNEILAWKNEDRDYWCDDMCGTEKRSEEECLACVTDRLTFSSLSEYLCDEIGCSQPKNVCACAMDLAKYNNMTMGELFTKYEG